MTAVMLVSAASFSGMASKTTEAADTYYPSLSFNLGKLSEPNTYIGKLTDTSDKGEMTTITIAGHDALCMKLNGSLSRYNGFYDADINSAYGAGYIKYMKGAVYYLEDENEEFSLDFKSRYVSSQIIMWRILQIRSRGKSGTYKNIMDGFESTFKSIVEYWGGCNKNTAWDEINTVMTWCNNDIVRVTEKTSLRLLTHADGTQPLIIGSVKPVAKKAYVKLQKKGKAAGADVSGAVYGIYSDKKCSEKKRILNLTTDENGNAATTKSQAKKLSPGSTYYVREIQAPKGSKKDNAVYKIVTSDEMTKAQAVKLTVTDEQYSIRIKGKKVSSTDKQKGLPGAVFRIYEWSINKENWIKHDDYATGNDGTFITGKLYYTADNAGKFKAEEIKAPEDYRLSSNIKYVQINGKNTDTTIEYTAENVEIPKEGYIAVQKHAYAKDKEVSSDEDLTAAFTIYSDKNCRNAVCTINTNASGYGKSTKIRIGTYYIKETGWSSFVRPESTQPYEVIVKTDETTLIDGTKGNPGCQKPAGVGFKLKKTDADDENVAIAGVKFKIYEKSQSGWDYLFEAVTDNEGIIEIPSESGKLYYTKKNGGRFMIKESEPAKGYVKDETPRYINIDKSNAGTTINLGIITNKAVGGRIEIRKTAALWDGSIASGIDLSSTELGITYGLFTDEECTKEANSPVSLNSDGKASFEDVRPGTYYLRETTANSAFFGMTGSMSKRVLKLTVSANKTTMADGELGYSTDGGNTWTDCWSSAQSVSYAGVSATALNLFENTSVQTVFGNRSYDIVSQDEETAESINDVKNEWKELSDEELDDIMGNSEDCELAEFLSNLSDDEYENITSRNTRLNMPCTTYETDDEGNLNETSSKTYLEYLMEMSQKPQTISTLNGTSGYFNISITGDGKTTNLKINVTVSGTNTTGKSIKAAFTSSGTNNHGVKLLSTSVNTTESGTGTGTGSYNIITLGITYSKSAHYYAKGWLSGQLSDQAGMWTVGSNAAHSSSASTVTDYVRMNLTQAGLRTIDGKTYHATFTMGCYKFYGALKVNPNGGKWTYGSGTYTGTGEKFVAANTCRSTASIPNPVREGYTFTGWSLTNKSKSHSTLTGNLYGGTISSSASTFTYCSEADSAATAQNGAYDNGTNTYTDYYSAVITANWKVNSYKVTVIDVAGSDPNGKEISSADTHYTFDADYGTTAYGSAAGNSTFPGAYHDGYCYTGCSGAVVTVNGATVYRYFRKIPTPVNMPNLLKNILKTTELDIIKVDSNDETKELDAEFSVKRWSEKENGFVEYLTGVKPRNRITLAYNADNPAGKYKISETKYPQGYKQIQTEAVISLSEGVTLPLYENLLGVDEDMGVYVPGRAYNKGEIVRDFADTETAAWYRCKVSNVNKKLSDTVYWEKITKDNYNRYSDLVNGAGEWDIEADVVTSMSVVLGNVPNERGKTDVWIKKINLNGEQLEGATFSLYLKNKMSKLEDFKFEAGNKIYSARNIDISQTQSNSTYNSETGIRTLNLVIKEEKAPTGYIPVDDIEVEIKSKLNNETSEWEVVSKTATFSDGTTVDFTEGSVLTLVDDNIDININLKKKSTDTSLDASTLAGAVYGIYDNEECTSLVKTIMTDETGSACALEMMFKDYWIKEISTPASGLYKLSSEVKHLDAEALLNENADVSEINADITFMEEPLYCEILIKKTGYDDMFYLSRKSLKGAGFSLYRMPEIPEGKDKEEYIKTHDFSKDHPVKEEILTDDDGIGRIKNLITGEYVLVETTVPEGYVKSYNVIINLTSEYTGNTDETAYEINICNEPYTAPVKIYKKSTLDESIKLCGAVFKIYDVNEGGFIGDTYTVTDEEGNETEITDIKYFTTDKSGMVITDSLKAGRYKIYETEAPAGYNICKEPVLMEIGEGLEAGLDERGYPYYEVTFQNDPTDTAFYKKDITTEENIKGGRYSVSTSDGEVIDEWTGNGEAHHTYGLIKGEKYIYSEIIAPDGYVAAEDIEFMINEDGSLMEVVMHDDYIKAEISKLDLVSEEHLKGCTLQILDCEGNVIDEWITDGTVHRINRLPKGEYVLHEKEAPDGYVRAEDVEFYITETTEIQEVFMYNDYTKTAFVKQASDTREALAGCVMQLKTADGEVIDEWTTATEPHVVYKLIPGEKYILHEKEAPDGYKKAEDITFTAGEEYTADESGYPEESRSQQKINLSSCGLEDDSDIEQENDEKVSLIKLNEEAEESDDNAVIEDVDEDDFDDSGFDSTSQVTVTMTDDPLEIIPEKVDENDNPVYGAVMQILDSEGSTVYEWTTGLMQTKGFKVKSGTYTIHEKEAPKGYMLCKDIEVKITDEDVYVKAVDHTMKAEITKTDEEKNPLKGAELQILDKDENVIHEWTSSEEAYVITDLVAGETYTLHEKEAPDGYVKAEDISFTMNKAEISITMTDKKTKVTIRKVNTYGNGISGAELQIIDEDGNVIMDITSKADGNVIRGLLKGEYVLHEENAPEGFKKAEDVQFTVTDSDKEVTVTMTDEYENIRLPLTGGKGWRLTGIAIIMMAAGIAGYIIHSKKDRKK